MGVLPFTVILSAQTTSKQTRKGTFIPMAQSHIAAEIPPSQASDMQEEKLGNGSAWLRNVQLDESLKIFPWQFRSL